MRSLYALVISLLVSVPALAQLGVNFQTLPRELQLYARDGANQAAVVVEGTVTDQTITRLACFLNRNGQLAQQQRFTLTDTRLFRFAPTIRAELADYGVQVYAYHAAGDSVLLAERKRLLCGDVFLIYGQSNAIGLGGLDQSKIDDTYMRQCGYPYGVTDIPSAMQWYPANQPYGAVGAFGLYMAEAVMAATNIPVCLINGAQGGAGIGQLTDRNASNPTDLTTFYGRMLYRTHWGGYQGKVRAMFYKQGEAEAGSSEAGYPANFDRLYKLLRQDYGNAPLLYVSQINIMATGQNNVGELRDFQRLLKAIYPVGIQNIATVGTQGYDGIHYSLAGNRQIAREQARQVLRDTYGLTADTLQIDSPNIRKVVQNSRNDSLTLVFEPQMQLVWTPDSVLNQAGRVYTRYLADVFYPDGKTGSVSMGRATGNRVQLALRQPGPVQTLTYLPPFFSDDQNGFYDGPELKNSRGMRAFSFDKVAVARALPAVTNLTLTPNTATRDFTLNWTVPTTDAEQVVLERAVAGVSPFTVITTLPAATTTYRDKPTASLQGLYSYRLRVVSSLSESGLSNIVEGKLPVICSLSVTIGGSTSLTIGAAAILTANVTGTLPATEGVTLRWTGPGTNTAAGNALTSSGLLPGSTNVYTVTATQGVCSATATAVLTVQPPCSLSVSIAGEQTIPFGGTLSLSAIVTGTQQNRGALSIRWTGPAGFATVSATVTQTGLTPGLSGTYIVTVMQGNCTASAVAAVVIAYPLAISEPAQGILVGPNPVRSGQPLWLQTAPGSSWTNPVHLTIWTLAGQCVLTRTASLTPQTELPLGALAPGFYLLDIADGTNAPVRQRLLVE